MSKRRDQEDGRVLERVESGLDTAVTLTESIATRVGKIASIIGVAVRDVTREIGEIATDTFEMAEAARRRSRDRDS